MKYVLPPKYADKQEEVIEAIRAILPGCEMIAAKEGKDVPYAAAMVLRSLATRAIQRNHQATALEQGERPTIRGTYDAKFIMWCDDQFIDSSEGDLDDYRNRNGQRYEGLQSVTDAALDFAEEFINANEPWPEELDEELVDRRIRTQRGNIYHNANGSALINFNFLHRNLNWLLQVRISRPAPEAVTRSDSQADRKSKLAAVRKKMQRK